MSTRGDAGAPPTFDDVLAVIAEMQGKGALPIRFAPSHLTRLSLAEADLVRARFSTADEVTASTEQVERAAEPRETAVEATPLDVGPASSTAVGYGPLVPLDPIDAVKVYIDASNVAVSLTDTGAQIIRVGDMLRLERAIDIVAGAGVPVLAVADANFQYKLEPGRSEKGEARSIFNRLIARSLLMVSQGDFRHADCQICEWVRLRSDHNVETLVVTNDKYDFRIKLPFDKGELSAEAEQRILAGALLIHRNKARVHFPKTLDLREFMLIDFEHKLRLARERVDRRALAS